MLVRIKFNVMQNIIVNNEFKHLREIIENRKRHVTILIYRPVQRAIRMNRIINNSHAQNIHKLILTH
jgi:hypothetical protein